jgi:glutathione synthase/RimK-type ligase-like ATP-grasp enzyme
LDGDDGYLFEVSDGAWRAIFAAGAGSPYALNDTRAASIARDKAFCAEVLRSSVVPVVPGRMFFVTKRWADMRGPGREPEDAMLYAADAKYPLFCKPISASNGLFAEVIADASAFAGYLERVSREHFAILAQPYIRASEYRVFILDDEPVFSYRKRPMCVVGDGSSTLSLLAGGEVRARDEAGDLIAPHLVLPVGATVILEGPANRAAGGSAEALREGAPAPLAELARAAANAVGLRLAAIDIFDRSATGDLSDLLVIEVNSNPMIATLEDHGRWDLIELIWRANFAAALK